MVLLGGLALLIIQAILLAAYGRRRLALAIGWPASFALLVLAWLLGFGLGPLPFLFALYLLISLAVVTALPRWFHR